MYNYVQWYVCILDIWNIASFFRIELIVIITSKGIREQETPGVTITPTVEYEQVLFHQKSYLLKLKLGCALVREKRSWKKFIISLKFLF